MSVKKMVKLYVSYGLDELTWDKFYNKCRSWHYNEDASAIVDGDGNSVYLLDENGFYKEV